MVLLEDIPEIERDNFSVVENSVGVVETALNEQFAFVDPADMAEALGTAYRVPLVEFIVVDRNQRVAETVVYFAADVEHQSSEKQRAVLVPAHRNIGVVAPAVSRRRDPVPTAASMLSQSPNLVESVVLRIATAINYNHARGAAHRADISVVVDAGRREGLSLGHQFPFKGSVLHVEEPNVVQRLGTRRTAEKNQVGFSEYKRVPISRLRPIAYSF